MSGGGPPPALPAGWYDDPDDPSRLRYWAGTSWTDARAPKNTPPRPITHEPKKQRSNRTSLMQVAVAIAGFLLLLAVCDTRSAMERFTDALEDGASCAELFEIRNEFHPREEATSVQIANSRLRRVGCVSSSATRTD